MKNNRKLNRGYIHLTWQVGDHIVVIINKNLVEKMKIRPGNQKNRNRGLLKVLQQ